MRVVAVEKPVFRDEFVAIEHRVPPRLRDPPRF